ncbi:MAG: radical SAM protein [Kiritimatiellia bacterium]|jgi:radical SAM superfamily enzyme YgiQ (UPF0313 family)|nr:radical SAM protein [Kiritimatiellia bacterium]MDP6848103.1 radical SAM protein [Kiritimatiellia bacterium]
MRVMLIAPADGKWRKVGRRSFFNGRTFRFSLLSLLSVAAETPAGVDVSVVDEQIEDIPWDAGVDLVGITCMTALAPRAYEIAAHFRRRGIPVVLGGVHATLCPDEAGQHADAVVVGDAEGIWHRVVADACASELKKEYRNPTAPSLTNLKPVPRHLLKGDRYATVAAIQATRGCPHTCSFCSVSAFHGGRQRQRPVEDVVREAETIGSDFFIFVDDNLTADRDYARRLMEAMIPVGKKWITQSTLAVADDPGFVQLAARAGCIGLFVGLETFNGSNLESVDKTFNKVEEYKRAIRLLHDNGIGVEAGIVLGFEGDRPEVFRRTLKMLDDLHIDAVQVSILTPIPGTETYSSTWHRLRDHDWSHYDFHRVVFQPKHMTIDQLQQGHDWITHEFYRPWRIARRFVRHALRPGGSGTTKYLAAINMAYWGRIRTWGIKGKDPAAAKNAGEHVRGLTSLRRLIPRRAWPCAPLRSRGRAG